MQSVYAIIMAGGAGTRFWPASRRARPKQLLPLASDPKQSLIAATVRRLAPLIPKERVYVATGAHLLEATAAELPDVPRGQLLAEPVPRNTAPCIGWASRVIEARDPDALIAVFPSDHHIADEAAFRATLEKALETGAAAGYLTTIGITYVAGKKHLWNAGMFFFRAGVMRKAIEAHLPDLATGLAQIAEGGEVDRIFPTLPSVSIDHGVMEKASPLAVIKGDFGWSDVGGWQSAWELAPKDAQGNALPEGALAIEAQRNMVRDMRGADVGMRKKVIALVGVSDLVVVETDDALVVVPRDRSHEVRAVVDALKARGDESLI
jgi:mannose-1-phosphate guanylyltransferase